MKKKFFSAILAAAFMLCLLPAAEATGGNRSIVIGTGCLRGGQVSSVYFGRYPQGNLGRAKPNYGEKDVNWIYNSRAQKNTGPYFSIDPIKWRVLSNSEGKALLLADKNLDVEQYNSSRDNSITWEASWIRKWLNKTEDIDSRGSFFSTAFVSNERAAIADTNVINAAYSSSGNENPNPSYATTGGNNTVDKIFLLSIAEAQNPGYGFTDNGNETDTRASINTFYVYGGGNIAASMAASAGKTGSWWLRSPGCFETDATIVGYDGKISYSGLNVSNSSYVAVRPAFNLNLSSVLFTSAPEGGKAGGETGANALTAVNNSTGSEWKLTLKDSARSSFTASLSGSGSSYAMPGSTLLLDYSGAKEGESEYVSAMLTDGGGTVLYYGRIVNSSTNGSMSVILPADLATGSYTLKVFSEQCNGDYRTDYASEFVDIPLTVTKSAAIPAATDNLNRWDTSIKVVNVQPGQEYAITKGSSEPTEGWQESGEFTGLVENTVYNIYTRVKNAAGQEGASVITPVKTKNRGNFRAFNIVIPSDYSYDGTPKAPAVTYNEGYSEATAGKISLSYEDNNTWKPVPECIAPGTYLFYISTDNSGSEYAAMKSFCAGAFSIARGLIQKSFFEITPSTADYDGSPKNVTVSSKSGITGIGSITEVYYSGTNGTAYETSTTPPTNAGKYTVSVNVAEGEYYAATNGVISGTFIINKGRWTGEKIINVAIGSGESGANTLKLPALPDGAAYGTPSVSGTIALIEATNISGTVLSYSTTAQPDGTGASIAIPVTGAANYMDYTVEIILSVGSVTPPSHDHTYGGWIAEGEARHYHVCIDEACPAADKGRETQPHSFGGWAVTKRPTPWEPGEEKRSCPVCGYGETRQLPATGDGGSDGNDHYYPVITPSPATMLPKTGDMPLWYTAARWLGLVR